MKALREISSISSYKPVSGDILLLYEMVTGNFTRKEALVAFKNQGKSNNRFRKVYKKLKDKLIKRLFTEGFNDYNSIKKIHFNIWKNLVALKVLIGTDKRNAVASLGKETFLSATKYGLIDVALTVAREMQRYFSTIEPNENKFNHYSNAVADLQKKLSEEIFAESVYSKLIFHLRKRKKLTKFEEKIHELEQIAESNKEYRFNLFFFSLKNYFYLSQNNQKQLIENCEEAIGFFQSFNTPLPYTTSFTF